MAFLSAVVLLFIVLDPLGNIPLFIISLKGIDVARHKKIILRESLIGLAVLTVFLFAGHYLLSVLHISKPSLSLAGGIILFLIAIKMVFSQSEEIFKHSPDGEPFIVPLAIPYIAGPSAISTVLLLMAREPARWPEWLLALLAAWTLSLVVLLGSDLFYRFFGKKGLNAIENLMGLLLTAVAVELFVQGLKAIL